MPVKKLKSLERAGGAEVEGNTGLVVSRSVFLLLLPSLPLGAAQ